MLISKRTLVVAHTEEEDTIRIITAREATAGERRFMKKANRILNNGLRPEYIWLDERWRSRQVCEALSWRGEYRLVGTGDC